MFSPAVIFLITTLGGLFAFALLLRFMLQLLRAPARNPLSVFVVALTDFVVRPARRVIPRLGRLDLATLALAWLTELAQLWLVLQLEGGELRSAFGIALLALAALAAVHIARLAVYFVMVAVVVQAVLSWVKPYDPPVPLLTSVTRPFQRPFQKFIPVVANIADWSPFAVLLVCLLLLALPLAWLEAVFSGLL